MQVTDKITITNEDNMDLMSRYPDKHFDLAIVDPPYGIGFGEFNRTNKDTATGKRVKANKYKNSKWDDSTPNDEYFIELKRVSKNQIVWGGNYFIQLAKKQTPNLKKISDFKSYIEQSDSKWCFWHKQNPVPNFADGELAWTSFNFNSQFDFRYYGNLEGNTSASIKYHPTQKPIKLYKWLLDKYAKQGDKILDTHLGSGSIAIACHDYDFELTACELDEEYYNKAIERIKQHTNQLQLF